MRVVFLTVKMDLCAGLRGLCLEERKTLRRETEPECSLALEQSLHGALQDGFCFVWTSHDHRAQGIVSKHDTGGDPHHQALSTVQESRNPAPLRNHNHAGSAKSRLERCEEKTRGEHAGFWRQTAHEPLKVADSGGGRNNVCSQRSRTNRQFLRNRFAHDRRPELECLKLFRTSQLPPESLVATPIVHSIRHIDLPQ